MDKDHIFSYSLLNYIYKTTYGKTTYGAKYCDRCHMYIYLDRFAWGNEIQYLVDNKWIIALPNEISDSLKCEITFSGLWHLFMATKTNKL
jgi:hypothetical protein